MNRLTHARDRAVIGAAAFSAAGLAIATDTTQPQSANAVDYSIDGKLYTKAASNPLGAPTGSTQGNSTKALYLYTVDSGGTVTVTQSAIVDSGDEVSYPELPDDEAPIGALKIVTNGSVTFEPGTDALSKTGVTTTYIDLARVPAGTE